ncbi:hypothetical protein B9Z55_021592 [Caenorhabditis nigoni]|uniref:F-box domain-containing protein n=1 Tax=Caenorhabditis nigoni TaxID=1611254 RepID=A0A2G5TSM6_9PELO|nr:hypothetical protein B9Z55_021592 [Caenorhabditis nigoni]
MPIRILSLPAKDLQYAIDSMNVRDLMAFSLCSRQPENLVKSSNRQIEEISAKVNENRIEFRITAKKFQELPKHVAPDDDEYFELISFNISESWIKLYSEGKYEEWRKEEFTQADWIPHILSVFNEPMINTLTIESVRHSYLDNVEQLIPKCHKLTIMDNCSNHVAKMTLSNLSTIAVENVDIYQDIFSNKNDISKLLSLNLKAVKINIWKKPLEIKLDDLLPANFRSLYISNTKITENELNRFLKLWMKSNHTYYRPERMSLYRQDER